jgi:hypothetical protein
LRAGHNGLNNPICSMGLPSRPDLQPKIYLILIVGFSFRMFRRRGCDETILLRMKPFSPLRADVPKRWPTINLPNETPPSGESGRQSC